ncbi:aminotransferase [Pseudoclavibacter endophyticus]|uniref:Aminotransferase n=1 Tax=Pseudoclavibacter endophyticus TaxID=1778590 RepID=A0A6H9WMW3_9MICO|nr:pyridoxal phosphate-dependent aminotransferase [Pseudoclavibacter endophyticus]KAB1648098.1 pyridoxal phosphate-dependent aminotransferase [Pseudoclavibacter endophyticus]GGA69709.1 aminotransferase [Pseudoclavibacter endophyticus]
MGILASPLSPRITAIAESATLKVDSKAKALKADGRPIISYAAGEPDFPTPQYVLNAALEATGDPRNHRYTAAAGLPELRDAIATKTRRDSGIDVPANRILVTNGGKQSVFQAINTVIGEGDELLLPAPYWTTYPEVVRVAGGTTVPVFAGADQGYKVTVEQLEAARTPRTKALLFCSPSNPTGAVYSYDETKAIGEWAESYGLWVISDEIYQNLTYGGVRATSIVEAVPTLDDQCILVNGVAKSFAMTGWRVGWMVGPREAIKAATNLQTHLTGNVNNIAQRAAVAALTGPATEAEAMRVAFDRRRQLMVQELSQVPGFVVPVPEGAFYVYADVTALLGREYGGRRIDTSLELADYLLEAAEVAVVPGEAFGPSGYVRLSYALGDDELVEGIQRMKRVFADVES